MNAEQYRTLVNKLESIQEMQPPTGATSASPPMSGGRPMSRPASTGPAMPDQPMNRQTQDVKPQADRPGLKKGGDPKLYDIQAWLLKKGYKDQYGKPIEPDGLNGDRTKFAYDQAFKTHSNALDAVHPSAVDIPTKIGQALGTPIGWIETAWKNLKKGFNNGVNFDVEAPPKMNESNEIIALHKKLNG
jgi:hypothetical protein